MSHGPAGPMSLVIVIWSLCACGERHSASMFDGWSPHPTSHARFFQVWSQGDERLFVTFGPGGNADTTGLFQLSPDGRFQPGPANAVHLRVPLARVALRSTTHAPFITALGRADAIVGSVQADLLREPALVARRDAGLLKEIASGDGLDRERLIALHPEVLFSYPFGGAHPDQGPTTMKTVQIGEYLEEHPLGRAEWLRVFGMLLGKEPMADSLYDAIAARYAKARSMVPPAARAPKVFFGSSWKGTWSVPAGNSYMARLIKDAGGDYLFADRDAKGNIDIDLETALETGAKADYWGRLLFQGPPVTPADVAGDDARIMVLPAFAHRGCFYANSDESDLFGQAVLEPDVVLRDLLSIFHPEMPTGRKPVYFKPVQ